MSRTLCGLSIFIGLLVTEAKYEGMQLLEKYCRWNTKCVYNEYIKDNVLDVVR